MIIGVANEWQGSFNFVCIRLQVGEVVTTIPTIGFNVEQVTYKNLKFQVWDLGGQTSIRYVTRAMNIYLQF